MPIKTIATGRALIGGREWADKAMSYGPIAYWPLNETSGTVAHCLINPAQNGVYNSDVSTWPVGIGIGDGNTAPRFDGVGDRINIFSATLQAAFNGAEGGAVIWMQVSGAGVWTDGTRREALRVIDTTDSNEYVWIAKDSINNQWWDRRTGNAVVEDIRVASGAPLTWCCAALTWSESDDEVKAWINGAQIGATQVGLGAWAGTIDLALIGSSAIPIGNPWSGGLAHLLILDRVLGQAAIVDLATV